MDQLTKATLTRDKVAARLRDIDRESKKLQTEREELERQLYGLDGYTQALEEVAAQAEKEEVAEAGGDLGEAAVNKLERDRGAP